MKKLFLLFLLVYVFSSAKSQNIFDQEHSYHFARSLACEGNYTNACKILGDNLTYPINDSVTSLYLHCLLNSSLNRILYQTIKHSLSNKQLSKSLRNQIAAICIQNDTLRQLLDEGFLESIDLELKLRLLILMGRENEGKFLLQKNRESLDTVFYDNWFLSMEKIKKNKVGKYIILSCLVPGTGKMLLGETYDGFLGLFVTASHGFLSIRSFQMAGISSIFGWLNLGMGLAFYGGNIIGTQRAVLRKTTYQKEQLYHELKENIYVSYYHPTCN